ncbi:lipopolysaccharide biosynthesis protein [Paenibacillus sp. 2TAB26]|uniref:lipopolysaccharide biosynthesis protein n=1 Tax=Paenibacillus sp. 2TAB26 TaxID=3233005 RepID=UPI003F9C0EB4
MNIKARSFINNFSYTITANFISLLISVLVVLIVPKLIGVEDYGYWQLYVFYASYVGFLQFGWTDGIYLRYGGAEYNEIDKRLFFSQFWMLVCSQIIIAGLIIIPTLNLSDNIDRQFVLVMVSLCMIVMGTRAMLVFILQATNRIKEYSQIIMIDRVLYCFLIVAFILAGIRDYELLISADLIGKFISLLCAMFYCRDIVYQKISNVLFNVRETFENISVGIKLMFANIASMLIIGVVRFGIERSWDISTFGKVSLTLNISNFVMLFINAVGIIMFPVLRRTSEERLPNIYVSMRDFLMVILLAALLLYFPLNATLSAWLPKYSDSLKYMALLFPLSVYEGKTALLTNTYLKTLRKEKLMLKINMISLILSVGITIFTTILNENLNLAIVSIVLLLAIRSILAEFYLSKILGISIYKDTFLDLLMTVYFILIAWYINTWIAVILYAIAYLVYFIIKKKDIINATKFIRSLIKL